MKKKETIWLKEAIKLFIYKKQQNNPLVRLIYSFIYKNITIRNNDRIVGDIFLRFLDHIDTIDLSKNEKEITSYIKRKVIWFVKDIERTERKNKKYGLNTNDYVAVEESSNKDSKLTKWEKIEVKKSVKDYEEKNNEENKKDMIQRALSKLNSKHRKIIEMIMEGHTKREIMEILKCGTETYILAQKKIKAILEKQNNIEELI